MNVRQVVPKDAIPSVDNPTFSETYEGQPDDSVIALETAGRARAYPLRYLHHHEIVNDDLGHPTSDVGSDSSTEPIAVTWCPLCGSAVVYDAVVDGRPLTFGVSGKLADDDLVMYDRETESHWKQSTGECFDGPMTGTTLSVRPAQVVPWTEFTTAYPDGDVLDPPGGQSESASPDATPATIDYDDEPYQTYFEAEGFGLGAHRGRGDRSWDRRDDIDPKTVVLGIEQAESAIGFPLPRVIAAGGIVQTTVGELPVVVVAGEDIGIQAFEDPGYDFDWGETHLEADGTTWNPVTGDSEDGRSLGLIPARRLFAFTWQDDHGPSAFWG